MKKTILLIFLSFSLFESCTEKENEKLTIAVAANMQFAIKELSKTFTDQTGIECELIISSSGKLTAQIKEGAPFDIFVSADMKHPTELFNTGFTENKPKIYAYGKLIIWSMTKDINPSFDLLKNNTVKHIAIANPKIAPYGAATIETLKYHNVYRLIKDKLVFGENIAQTNQFIVSKSAEIGFTAKSIVLSTEMKNKGKWIPIDDQSYSLISQGVVVLKHDKLKLGFAEKFYNFISTNKAKAILENLGYSIN